MVNFFFLKGALCSKASIKCAIRLEYETVSAQQLGEKHRTSSWLFCYVTPNNQFGWVPHWLIQTGQMFQSYCHSPWRSALCHTWSRVHGWAPGTTPPALQGSRASVLTRLKGGDLYEALRDEQLELAPTARKGSPSFFWVLHMCWYSSRQL